MLGLGVSQRVTDVDRPGFSVSLRGVQRKTTHPEAFFPRGPTRSIARKVNGAGCLSRLRTPRGTPRVLGVATLRSDARRAGTVSRAGGGRVWAQATEPKKSAATTV